MTNVRGAGPGDPWPPHQACKLHRFALATAALGASLLDRFLSRHVVTARAPRPHAGRAARRARAGSPSYLLLLARVRARRGPPVQAEQAWLLPLAAVAALSVAAKMEEPRLPPLVELQV